MSVTTGFKRNKLALLVGLSCVLAAQNTLAEDVEVASAGGDIQEVIITADKMGLMNEKAKSVFGFDKSILETPRSVTSVSAKMMESYAITDIDDLVLVSPGAFTQSFFGVAGSLDVRGTPGEVYFRGVRRVNNPGNYPTPIGASDSIDIVRGPASPIYGPSKIGGYLNFEPKSARVESGKFMTEPKGEISLTRGSWDKNVLSAEVGGPGKIGDKDLGYYIYAETENSGSYYDNSGTDQNILQASFDLDISDSTKVEFGGMYQKFDGNQVAGWNRLTQDLIDNGTYITGSPQSVDTSGDGYNSPAEYDAWKASFSKPNNFFFGFGATDADMDPKWALQNPGTAKLEGNQTLVAPEDQLVTTVSTVYFDVTHEASDTFTITNKAFYEKLENINENAYGFSQFVDTYAIEDQVIFALKTEPADWLKANYQFSPSIRYTNFKQGDDFDYEYFDRRDLTKASSALDRKLLATVTDSDYANYLVGDFTDYGLAVLADYTIAEKVGLLLGARYDYLDMESHAVAEKLKDPSEASAADNSTNGVSWTASLSYTTPFGLIPYVTKSEQATIVMGQGSEISPGLIAPDANGDVNALADSTLEEIGVKGSFFKERLFFTADYFTQTRTNYSAQDLVSNNTTESKGYELEGRFLFSENFTVTTALTHLEITNLTAKKNGVQFGFAGAGDLTGVTDPSLFYGYVMQGLTEVKTDEDAEKSGIPKNMISLTGAYNFGNGFSVTASSVHADSTYSGFSKAIKLPSYTLFNAGLTYATDTWSISLQGKNLTNERYFRSNFPDLFGSTIVLPELPRSYVAKFGMKF